MPKISKRSYRKKGGSPASVRVMNLLPAKCNIAPNVNFPVDNGNISKVQLYNTTGGYRKRSKKAKKNYKSRKNKSKSRKNKSRSRSRNNSRRR